MKVKYVGKSDQITCDYNGKRYVFSKRNPVQDIPVEVWRYINDENQIGILREWVIPIEADEKSKPAIQEAQASKEPAETSDLETGPAPVIKNKKAKRKFKK